MRKPLWIASAALWFVAIVGWPLLTAIGYWVGQRAIWDFETHPWSWYDSGGALFLIAAPLAVVTTVAAAIIKPIVETRSKTARGMMWLGAIIVLAAIAGITVSITQGALGLLLALTLVRIFG